MGQTHDIKSQLGRSRVLFAKGKNIMGHHFNNMGKVGGRAASATPGGYNQGNQIAATGGFRGGVGSHMDLRNKNAAGSGPDAAPPASGFHQGDQFAMQRTGSAGSVPGKSMGKAGRSGKPGSAKESNGYVQGDQFAASKK